MYRNPFLACFTYMYKLFTNKGNCNRNKYIMHRIPAFKTEPKKMYPEAKQTILRK